MQVFDGPGRRSPRRGARHRGIRWLVPLTISLLAALPAPARATAVDPTFGGGLKTIDLTAPSVDVATAVDRAANAVVGSAGGDMAVAFVNGLDAGTLAFGDQGRVKVPFGRPSVANAVAPSSEVMYLAGAAGDDFALAALGGGPARTPARGFGQDGQVTTSFGAPAAAHALLKFDNGLLAAGDVRTGSGSSVALARYDLAGGLDPGFGTAGRVVVDSTTGTDTANVAAWNGAAGSAFYVAGQAGDDSLVSRFLFDGRPDTSFGVDGRVVVNLSPGADVARALTVGSDGRITFAGSASANGFVARMRSDGTLDPTFGSAGVVLTNLGTTTRFNGLGVSYDGARVVAAGTVTTPGGDDVAVVGLNGDGSLRADFGTGGRLSLDLGGSADVGNAVSGYFDSPDRLLIAGGTGQDMATVVLDGAGVAVARGGSTVVLVDFGSPSNEAGGPVVVQPDGAIVVAGTKGSASFLVRLLPDGRVDPSFRAGRPMVWEAAVTITDLALQGDGRILASGGHVVARFLASGEVDDSFGSHGLAYVEAGGPLSLRPDGGILVGLTKLSTTGDVEPDSLQGPIGGDTVVASRVRPDGSLLVVSGHSNYTGVSLTRFNADGVLDSSFGNGAAAAGRPKQLVTLAEGRILVVAEGGGSAGTIVTPPGIVLSRYNPNGFLDHTYGADGIAIAGAAAGDHPVAAAVGPDGSVTVVAQHFSEGTTATHVVRFRPDGQVDHTFGLDGLYSSPAVNYPTGAAFPTGGSVVVAGTIYRVPSQGATDVGVMRILPDAPAPAAVRAWGANGAGELGDNTTADRTIPSGPGLADVTAVSAGVYHSLALRNDGTVWAWGWNGWGQIGDGSTTQRNVATQVNGLSGIVAIAAGGYHSLALRNDGTVWAWGWNGFGQLGTGTTAESHVPVQVPGLTGVTSLAGGAVHSLALGSDGSVWAWGWNALGQLGDGSTVDRHQPVRAGVGGASSVTAGYYHSAAITSGRRVATWGWNGHGQLGRNGSYDPRPGPVDIDGVVALAAGGLHTVVAKADGTVWSWGYGGVGELGNGTRSWSQVPVVADRVSGVVAVSAGAFHTLARCSDGTVKAWGWNSSGQLGDGSTTDRLSPVTATGVEATSGIAAGAIHSLAL